MVTTPQYRKKLIEVALPQEAINKEALHRKQKAPKGFPTSFHKWWAQRPLAACRAVLFASIVDDPSSWPEIFPTDEDQATERERIFAIIEEFVRWENSQNKNTLLKVYTEIAKSLARNRKETPPRGEDEIREYIAKYAPAVCDPFCGGGSIPLEAQRLGLEIYGSDLNPVSVLITKALIEIPPKFVRKPPINPESRKTTTLDGQWEAVQGLAEDVRYYGKWMREEAEKRIGHLYPKVKITEDLTKNRPDLKSYIGKELKVIAWLWARTVSSPNPTVNGVHVPLVQSWWLSTKKGKEAWVEPIIDRDTNSYRFEVRMGIPTLEQRKKISSGTKIGRGCKFKCIIGETPIPDDYVKAEGMADRLKSKLLAVAVEGDHGRIYLSPVPAHEQFILNIQKPSDLSGIDSPLAEEKRAIWCYLYGMTNFDRLFTPRQLVALTTFSNLVQESHEKILSDAISAGTLPNDERRLDEGGIGAMAYADAIATYLACVLDRMVYYGSSLTTWLPKDNALRDCMPRQGLAMSWDYAEGNPLGKSSGDVLTCTNSITNYLDIATPFTKARVEQLDARFIGDNTHNYLFSTDPPYYDNIGYADLSDYFYVWLRRSIPKIFPSLFATVLTPKKQELIASPYRHDGNNESARTFFEQGLSEAFSRIYIAQNPNYPVTIYYAFKQVEVDDEVDNKHGLTGSVVSTGWETFLEAVIRAGFTITGTWPMRTEGAGRLVAKDTNALASSIVLVCRPRLTNAPLATRREFITTLKEELPSALKTLQQSSIAPVDLAQAAIGPGMATFTRYTKVMESDGSPMTVRTALALINQTLDEVLSEQEGDFDSDTRWAIAWFEQYGLNEGLFGTAETLSRAKNTAINALVEDGLITARAGKVRLVARSELSEDWDPTTDRRLTAWESTQQLIKALEQKGESGAAELLKKLGIGMGETARNLAYRLYIICDRKKWTDEALSYNGLITSWLEIQNLVHAAERTQQGQQTLAREEE